MKSKIISAVSVLGSALALPVLAAPPTPSELAGYVATTTDAGSDYIFASVFDGNILTFTIVIGLLAAAIWFVFKAVRRIFG